jgi:anti-anti-sigma factor
MRLTTSRKNDITVLTVAGEFNVDSVRKFNDAVGEAMSEQYRDFVVDLAGVTTIDSAGLEALTALQRQCEEQLGMVRFSSPDGTLRKILEITRLDQNLTLHETVEDAMSSFA